MSHSESTYASTDTKIGRIETFFVGTRCLGPSQDARDATGSNLQLMRRAPLAQQSIPRVRLDEQRHVCIQSFAPNATRIAKGICGARCRPRFLNRASDCILLLRSLSRTAPSRTWPAETRSTGATSPASSKNVRESKNALDMDRAARSSRRTAK